MPDLEPPHISNRSGSADLNAGHDINIGGDVVGRDKIVITGEQQYDVHSLANPYLGLQSFTYADHARYAGREKLIADTVTRLAAPGDPLSLLFVTGASGSGESSLKVFNAHQEKWVVQFHLEELRRAARRHGRLALRKDYVLVLLFVKYTSDKYAAQLGRDG